jgi:protein SCO1/2
VSGCGRTAFRGKEHIPPRPVPEISLRDHLGRPFGFGDNRGRVLLVFFGYTRCPDVCPLTMATFRDVHNALGREAARVRFVFVTVDPDQDTRSVLDQYIRLFNPEFIGITGAPEELRPAYEFFRAAFKKVPAPGSAVGYLMAHSVNVAVIDREGRWRLDVDHDAPAADMAHDIRLLLRRR